MPVVAAVLPLPDTYDALITKASDGPLYWKQIDTGRARWIARTKLVFAEHVRRETERVLLPVLARAQTLGEALTRVEQTHARLSTDWAETLAEFYLSVSGDFAQRTARGIRQQVRTSKAAEDVFAALAAGELEERWQGVVARWLVQNGARLARGLSDQSIRSIALELRRGTDTGLSIPDIAKRIRDYLPGHSLTRGVTIARTEVISASNLGARAGAIDTGLELDHEWIATPGPRTRPQHASADGQVKPLDEPFSVWGELLMFPGDSSRGASAKNRVNCRCTAGYRPKTRS